MDVNDLSVTNLQSIFLNADHTAAFLETHQLIPTPNCPVCGQPMILSNEQTPRFRCRQHNMNRSRYSGTPFHGIRVPINKLMLIFLHCCIKLKQVQSISLSGESERTVHNIYQLCRQAATVRVWLNGEMLGGENRVIEIDEALFGRKKNNSGNARRQNWVFGMFERRENGEQNGFVLPVQNRTQPVLFGIMEAFIQPQTTVLSDCWAAYATLQENLGFPHRTVNHQYFFKDPVTHTHINSVEGMWSHLRRFMPDSGTLPHHLLDYCSLFTVLHIQKISFLTFLRMVFLFSDEQFKACINDEVPLDAQNV